MILASLLAAVYTFTATANGVEKGAVVEFMFTGRDSDRNYEALFEIDGSVEDFCRGVEKAGIPRGAAVDVRSCRLWPAGCPVTIDPPLSEFVDAKVPDGYVFGDIIYTGGTRDRKGHVDASTNMPLSVFATYSLAQSPLVFNGVFPQGDVYNTHTVRKQLRKGEKVTFRLSWDEKRRPLEKVYEFKPGNAKDVLTVIRKDAETAVFGLIAQVDFSPELSIEEAQVAATALSFIDSLKLKVNGRTDGRLFYRAFLPLEKWRDRKERLVQPLELNLGETNNLVFIEEDWTVDGDDPRLTPKPISFAEACKKDRLDTCFVFVRPQTKLSQIYKAMEPLKGSRVINWYVYLEK